MTQGKEATAGAKEQSAKCTGHHRSPQPPGFFSQLCTPWTRQAMPRGHARRPQPGGHSQGACARSSLETTLSSNLTSSLFLVAETQGNKIHGQTAVSSPALPPPAMPGSCTQVQRCGCPTGRRTAGAHKLVTADCAVGRGGSVTQSTAPRSGQATELPRRTLSGVPRAQRCV